MKRLIRSGHFDLKELELVLAMLVAGKPLPPYYNNHQLQGTYADCLECHLKGNLLLIYKIDVEAGKIVVAKIGSHSELFRAYLQSHIRIKWQNFEVKNELESEPYRDMVRTKRGFLTEILPF